MFSISRNKNSSSAEPAYSRIAQYLGEVLPKDELRRCVDGVVPPLCVGVKQGNESGFFTSFPYKDKLGVLLGVLFKYPSVKCSNTL